MTSLVPTESQRRAIEADPPALVLAGPGAGKTFAHRAHPTSSNAKASSRRINAFIHQQGSRGDRIATDSLGESAHLVKRGTIHAFCAEFPASSGTTSLERIRDRG